MSFERPTLTDLQNLVAQDIAAVGPLLRFSNLGVVGKAVANLANLHYGYLDWISKQANPYTATDEFMEAWAALKRVYRKAATSASGSVTFTGTPGTVLATGLSLVRTDGKTFTTTTGATVSGGGTATVSAVADADPQGLLGAFGNTAVGVQMAMATAVPGVLSTGVVSTAFTGGADLESDDDLRTRMLQAYQNPPQGGAASDYITWALEIPGVTRAWVARNGFGVGTVVVYFMMDDVRALGGGFPVGDNGLAADESRGVAATGDQLLVADYLYPLQPVTALVYAVAPTEDPIDFDIAGIPTDQRSAVEAAITDLFMREGGPGGTVSISHVWAAVESAAAGNSFTISSPSADIVSMTGALATLGTVTWT